MLVACNRVGLALCGNLSAALRVMNDGDPEPAGEQLREWAAHDGDVRDLLAFAASPEYVRARRGLGVTIEPGSAESEVEADANASLDAESSSEPD